MLSGWYSTYRRDENTRRYIQMVIGLALLPADVIQEGKDWLETQAHSKECRQFLSFYQKYWIDKWGPDMFSVYRRSIRTNNDCEGKTSLFAVSQLYELRIESTLCSNSMR